MLLTRQGLCWRQPLLPQSSPCQRSSLESASRPPAPGRPWRAETWWNRETSERVEERKSWRHRDRMKTKIITERCVTVEALPSLTWRVFHWTQRHCVSSLYWGRSGNTTSASEWPRSGPWLVGWSSWVVRLEKEIKSVIFICKLWNTKMKTEALISLKECHTFSIIYSLKNYLCRMLS